MLSLYPRNRQNIRKSPKFKERFAKKENTKETAIIKKEHRYGSANCYACKLKKKDSKELWFTRCEFSDAEIEIKNVNFSDFHRSVRAQSTPFFDKQGKMCIYGYGQKRTDTDELYPHAILKYCSDGSHRFCTVNIKGVSTWCLHNFGWHSPIFDAILAVPEEIQDIELAEDEIEQCFVRSFDKVIIPDNYKAEDQFYPTKNISYGEMFRRLDPKTQAVVDERYQEQQQNKIKDCAVSTL